jgi:anhydro-N-acetylmuramic acid kinase
VHPIQAYAARQERCVVGLISGTSADGIDVARVRIDGTGAVALERFDLVPLPEAVRTVLFELFAGHGEVRDAARMHVLVGELFADAAGPFLDGAHLVASHGQTIFHQPVATEFCGHPVRCTWQLGDGCILAARTGLPVVSDFRVADMAVGGEGAPLVPYADVRLFSHPELWRVALNIGGIANLTWLPPLASGQAPRAFDTGPGNALLDAVTRLRTGQPYDANGDLAAQGQSDATLLARLLEHPYFQRRGARSTGREDFGLPLAHSILEQAGGRTTPDLLATLAALTAETVARGLEELPRVDEIYVAGGGAHNRTLISMLSNRLSKPVHPLADLGINVDAREAVAFALMGDATMRGEPSNVPTATGARGPAILGKISLPPKS